MRDSFVRPNPPSPCEALLFISLLRERPQLLDWNYVGQGLYKFTSKWGQNVASEVFKVTVREAITWWFNDGKVWKCSITSAHVVILFHNTPFLYTHTVCLPQYEDHLACEEIVRIGHTLNALNISVQKHCPFTDVEAVAKYLQYKLDLALYKVDSASLEARIRVAQKMYVQNQLRIHRSTSCAAQEQAIWDWCPLWYVVLVEPDLFTIFPEPPWSHDGKPLTLSIIFSTIL